MSVELLHSGSLTVVDTMYLGRCVTLSVHSPATRSPAWQTSRNYVPLQQCLGAYESADIEALVALLADDVFMSMPPLPLEYEGRDLRRRLLRRHLRLRPQIRPHADTSQRSARVRGLPGHPDGHPPRYRPPRAHPRRRPDLRPYLFRKQPAPRVRATAITREPDSHPGLSSQGAMRF